MKKLLRISLTCSILLLITIILTTCSVPLSDAYERLMKANGFAAFEFSMEKNPELPVDCRGVYDEENERIDITLPTGTDVSALIPEFKFLGKQVLIGETEQKSGITPVDLSATVVYTVVSYSDISISITVNVTFEDFEETKPTLTEVTIFSSNTGTNDATVGDTVTLTMTASETLLTHPTVTFSIGQDPVADTIIDYTGSGSGPYTATYTVDASDTLGLVEFTISFQNMNEVAGDMVTTLTSGTGITTYVETTEPLGPNISTGTWNYLGTDEAGYFGTTSREPKLTKDSSGTPYLAFYADGGLSFAYFDGTGWTGDISMIEGLSYEQEWDYLILPNDTLVAATLESGKLRVYYNKTGTTWDPLSPPIESVYTGAQDLTGHAVSLTSDEDNNFYVLLQRHDDSPVAKKLTCFKYTESGGSWSMLGTDGFTTGRTDGKIDLVWDGTTLLAACGEGTWPEAFVYEYLSGTDTWAVKGAGNFASGDSIKSIEMESDGTDTYVALRCSADLEVYKWSDTDSTWLGIGGDVGTVDTSSVYQVYDLEIVAGVPVVVYKDTSPSRGRIKSFNGITWEGSIFNNADWIMSSSLIFNNEGQPIVAFEDGITAADGGVSVKILE
ncbi:MAG: hypothetical protein JEY99_02730 [Spirochaetales bacterium]|nr:hypothetical protein [Spirochaetales bacterium]